MTKASKLAVIGKECVACGTCVAVCPKGAIHVHQGVTAVVDEGLCIGCGKCARVCPAAVIGVAEREVAV